MNGKPKVLLVDGEENVLRSITRLMRTQPFDLVTTASPFEALHLVCQDSFAVVVCEYSMPVMNGVDILEKVRAISPGTIRMILTAYSDVEMAVNAINRASVFKMIHKPWSDDDLLESLHQATALFHQQKTMSVEPLLQMPSPAVGPGTRAPQGEDISIGLKKQLSNKILEQLQEIHTLNQNLDNSQLSSLRALARMLRLQNKSLAVHGERVAKLCKAMSLPLNYPAEIFQLEVAALLHDIGEVGIPKEIFSKSQHALTLNEKAYLQSHTLQGESLVGMMSMFKEASKLICHHHEHYDGSGYPDGLKGDTIPLGARMIAVADAYDNVLYGPLGAANPKMTPQQAFNLLETQSAAKLDLQILSVLKTCLGGTSCSSVTQASGSPENAKLADTPSSGKQKPLTLVQSDKPHIFQQPPSQDSRDAVSAMGWTELMGPAGSSGNLPEPHKTSDAGTSDAPPWWLEILVTPADENRPVPKTEKKQAPSACARQAYGMVMPQQVQKTGSRGRKPSGDEQMVSSKDLSVGMILSRDLMSERGGKLLPAGTVLKKEYITTLQQFLTKENTPVFIYEDKFIPPYGLANP